MKHSCFVNGFSWSLETHSSLNLSKLDVLSDLEEILVCTAYQYKGQCMEYVPADMEILENVECVFQRFPGWKCDISTVFRYKDLPSEAKAYVEYIEEALSIPSTL